MESGQSPELTMLLAGWKRGDEEALDKLMPLVYNELRRIADHHLRVERSGHTLQPTALIHEAYLKLVQGAQPDWQSRVHFFGVASRTMRQVLVDWARRNHAAKRGGPNARTSLNEALVISQDKHAELLAIDDALTTLGEFNERGCRAIEMKYFGGLSNEEIGEALHISLTTVGRDLRAAEAWLRTQLSAV